MSNPYGIALDREWTEWAAKIGVSPTVAAALFLISERHPSHEVMAKLTLGEGERVAAIVQRWPDCFPPGSLDALKCRSQTLAQPPSVRVSADPTSRRRPARVSAESLHRRAYTRRFEHAQGAGMQATLIAANWYPRARKPIGIPAHGSQLVSPRAEYDFIGVQNQAFTVSGIPATPFAGDRI